MRSTTSGRLPRVCAAAILVAGLLVGGPAAWADPAGTGGGGVGSAAGGAVAVGLPSGALSTPFAQPTALGDDGVLAGALRAVAPADRIAGGSRYETAAKIAAEFGHASAVVIANGENAKGGFDALAAGYLAGLVGAPILLTQATTLAPVTADAVRTVLAGASKPVIYIMGATDSVSDEVAARLNEIAAGVAGAAGDYLVRVQGANRYETSVRASSSVDGAAPAAVALSGGGAKLPTAILTSGVANTDALAAGPLSNALGIPILLTGPDQLPPAVVAAIGTLGIQQLIVLGGTDRVPDSAVDQAKAAGVTVVKRIAGENRFATAADLYTFARGTLTDATGKHYAGGTRVFLANGVSGFPDALAVGPLAAKNADALLTVEQDSLPPQAQAFLTAGAGAFKAITALGASASVGDSVLAAAERIIGSASPAAPPPGTQPGPSGGDPGGGSTPPDGSGGTGGSGGSGGSTSDNQRFVQEAAALPWIGDKVNLALTFLPDGGAQLQSVTIAEFVDHPEIAGATVFVAGCPVYISYLLPDTLILDIVRHEYVHVLQCITLNHQLPAQTLPLERQADAGAKQMGATYLYYVITYGPLTSEEISGARQLLASFGIN